MSGGRYNYLYSTIGNTFEIESGHYGINIHQFYEGEAKAARKANPMKDRELSEMLYDFTCLLHGLEWMMSGDICEETYRRDVDAFKAKWFCRKSNESVQSYKNDIREFLHDMMLEVDG